MSAPFFETIRDSRWNACVGRQGSEINYVDGYLEAARILAETVIEEKLMGSRDTLAMPILYNVRHGLELALKYVVAGLERLELVRRREGQVNHDINAYWEHLRDANVADRRTREAVTALKPFVESLSRIDADGQELRYFENREGGRSLGDLNVINLTLVRGNVETLGEILHVLTERADRLVQEHHTGTRTARCSRDDLAEIAQMLGPNVTWTEDAFLERKAQVMKRFGLTRRAFSNAIDAIRASRPLAASVGLETPLAHLDDRKLIAFAERWLRSHPPQTGEEPAIVTGADIDFEEMKRYTREMAELATDTEAMLSPDEFADLEAVFYIGRDRRFGEEYDGELERARQVQALRPRRWNRIDEVVSKTNLLQGLVAGLRRVGRPTLADQLAELAREAAASAA